MLSHAIYIFYTISFAMFSVVTHFPNFVASRSWNFLCNLIKLEYANINIILVHGLSPTNIGFLAAKT